jgi:hypothetical protein
MDTLPKDIENIIINYKNDLEITQKVFVNYKILKDEFKDIVLETDYFCKWFFGYCRSFREQNKDCDYNKFKDQIIDFSFFLLKSIKTY